jgi:uncharacterized surface protein with fasciclin (FAS1) repeats
MTRKHPASVQEQMFTEVATKGNMSKKLLAMLLLIPAMTLGVAACSSDDSSSDTSGTTDTATEMPADQNIVQVASESSDLTTLVDALVAADLVSTLEGTGPFTVFAPTNEAFAALPAGELDRLLQPANKEELATILKNHVVSGEVMSSDLSDGQKVETLAGETVTVSINGDTVKIGDATVSQADVAASNGVVHIVDTVILPAG